MNNKKKTYECKYKNTKWKCEVKDIEKSKQITGFTVTGRGSWYRVYLIELNKLNRWLDIPIMGISVELSRLDDVFWNSEKLAEKLNSIIDGLTIANGLKIIGENI